MIPPFVLICCGSGGVGKTTSSAALALRLAAQGHRVAVLTIDPARRLADSLGIGALGNEPQAVPLARLGLEPAGSLDAMMLDMKATFDAVIRQHAPDAATAARILENRYYRFVSTRLAGSHEYMAVERLRELAQTGRWDVIVLDTPPTRHALEFLRAPERLSGLMDEGVLHWLSLPRDTRGLRALERGSEVVVSVLKRLVGEQTIGDIAEFFHAFRGMWAGFRERSLQAHALLRNPRTRFVLVTTAAPSARREAQGFLGLLREAGFPFGGFIINRVVPAPATTATPESLPPRPPGWDAAVWSRICAGVAGARAHQERLAQAERAYLEALRQEADGAPMWTVPELEEDVHDLTALHTLGGWLDGAARGLVG